jgi:signal-transduction protein with cAMP-binding, CBS, and nucleotidyltransferase domain
MLQPLVDFLRDCAPFSALPPPQLEFLAKRLQSRYYASGQTVAPRGGLCVVRRGRITLHDRSGATLGTGAMMHGECRGVAASDTLCLELDAEGLDALRRQAPAVAAALTENGTQRPSNRADRPQGPHTG